MATLDDLLSVATRNARVCPQQTEWLVLYDLLPGKHGDQYGMIPASPLVMGAWATTSDDQKRERVREHLVWAVQHGVGARVLEYLVTLGESRWHHEAVM